MDDNKDERSSLLKHVNGERAEHDSNSKERHDSNATVYYDSIPKLGEEEPEINDRRDRTNSVYYDSLPRITYPKVVEEDVEIGSGAANIHNKVTRTEVNSDIQVYKRRWYILMGYSMLAMSQNFVWNTWGPISASAEEAFLWHDSTIAWLANWGPVAYIVCGLLFPWLLQVKGLRIAVVSSMVLVAVGAVLRCITSDPATATISGVLTHSGPRKALGRAVQLGSPSYFQLPCLIHMGQFSNGLAGPVAMGAMPALSATWFPPKERITATALCQSIGVSGIAISFILGPLLVTEKPPKHTSSVNFTNLTTASIGASIHYAVSTKPMFIPEHFHTTFESANITDARIKKERHQIMDYMYYEGIVCVALCLMVLIHFPTKPPKPPSMSAVVERDKYWAGLWSLRKKGSFLVVALVYGVSTGVVNNWSSVLSVNLKTVNISEDTAGWIGFYTQISVCLGTFTMGRFANLFARRMQLFILILYVLGTACFLVFTLMLIKIIPFSTVGVWTTIIGGSALINSAVPLMYELACELAYPTSEGAATGLMTYLNNVGAFLFLAVFSFPNVGTMWMNWATVGSCLACIPFIGLLRGRFHRLEIDEKGLEQTIQVDVDGHDYHDDEHP